jgi:hypothetical protein
MNDPPPPPLPHALEVVLQDDWITSKISDLEERGPESAHWIAAELVREQRAALRQLHPEWRAIGLPRAPMTVETYQSWTIHTMTVAKILYTLRAMHGEHLEQLIKALLRLGTISPYHDYRRYEEADEELEELEDVIEDEVDNPEEGEAAWYGSLMGVAVMSNWDRALKVMLEHGFRITDENWVSCIAWFHIHFPAHAVCTWCCMTDDDPARTWNDDALRDIAARPGFANMTSLLNCAVHCIPPARISFPPEPQQEMLIPKSLFQVADDRVWRETLRPLERYVLTLVELRHVWSLYVERHLDPRPADIEMEERDQVDMHGDDMEHPVHLCLAKFRRASVARVLSDDWIRSKVRALDEGETAEDVARAWRQEWQRAHDAIVHAAHVGIRWIRHRDYHELNFVSSTVHFLMMRRMWYHDGEDTMNFITRLMEAGVDMMEEEREYRQGRCMSIVEMVLWCDWSNCMRLLLRRGCVPTDGMFMFIGAQLSYTFPIRSVCVWCRELGEDPTMPKHHDDPEDPDHLSFTDCIIEKKGIVYQQWRPAYILSTEKVVALMRALHTAYMDADDEHVEDPVERDRWQQELEPEEPLVLIKDRIRHLLGEDEEDWE